MQINELNAYSVDDSDLGKSPPIWTPETGCFLLSHADDPKTKSLVNYSFTRLSFVSTGLWALLRPFSGPSLAVRRGLEPLTPCVTGTYSNQLN